MNSSTLKARSAQGGNTLRIEPLSAATGAECTDVDLKHLRDGEWERLFEAYHRSSLLVVRDQALPKSDQIAFSKRFGELELPIRKDYIGKDYADLHVVTNVGPDAKPSLPVLGRFWGKPCDEIGDVTDFLNLRPSGAASLRLPCARRRGKAAESKPSLAASFSRASACATWRTSPDRPTSPK